MAHSHENHYLCDEMTEPPRDTKSFTPDEMKEIRRLLGDEDADQVCPRCGGEIHLRGPVAGGGSIGFVWHAKCPTCDLSSMVVENMARFRDDPLNQEGIQP